MVQCMYRTKFPQSSLCPLLNAPEMVLGLVVLSITGWKQQSTSRSMNSQIGILASVEAIALAEAARRKGDVVERMLAASEAERRRNRELIKQLTRSLYFLVKHHMPHTTTFEDLIELQIDNGNEQLETHKRTCPSNAMYVSKATTSELLSSISHCIEGDLMRLRLVSSFP